MSMVSGNTLVFSDRVVIITCNLEVCIVVKFTIDNTQQPHLLRP
jgi:hypothetical protein